MYARAAGGRDSGACAVSPVKEFGTESKSIGWGKQTLMRVASGRWLFRTRVFKVSAGMATVCGRREMQLEARHGG